MKAQTPPPRWMDRSFRTKLYPGISIALSGIFELSHVSVITSYCIGIVYSVDISQEEFTKL